jgi:hypothetical protein
MSRLAPNASFVAVPAAEGQGFVSNFPQAKATFDNSSSTAKVRIFLNKQLSANCKKSPYVLLCF